MPLALPSSTPSLAPTPALLQRNGVPQGEFITRLKAAGKFKSTSLIVGLKQGQSLFHESTVKHADSQPIINAIRFKVSFLLGDNAVLTWLKSNGSDAPSANANLLAKATELNIK
ncbi:uncharacterized protein BP5553_09893 [Venustampulla echinocandica]|uniref:Uncharacterized protein n=1 Tax=Venustampulla echinocandica TaxID=2656787 RepID=A0A370TAZ8_9HELO|nr:uncharacterized protein BP5553_09893 [Venustampulla echinocandica]RDL31104.1 hypothetical protein BP5553_09893 [Venustampulla echinocandica]